MGGGGPLVQQPNRIDQSVLFTRNTPRPVVLGISFGFDVPPKLDQGDQAIEPGAVLRSLRSGEPANLSAEVAGGLGLTDTGREFEPGTGEQELGLALFGLRPIDCAIEEAVGAFK